MINALGKALVLIHLSVSMFALTWAAGVFLQFTDWGWKEPRKMYDQRVPSEIDKRSAALAEAYKARDLVLSAVPLAQAKDQAALEAFPQNHLWYMAELARLAKDPGAITVKEIKYAGAAPEIKPPLLGIPVLEKDVSEIQKSYAKYEEDLKAITVQYEGLQKDIRATIAKTMEITFQLNGKDDTGKQVRFGLLDLLEMEKNLQDKTKDERKILMVRWAETLKEADQFLKRRQGLEKTLKRLQETAVGGIKK